jgi:TatD DNase family protein
LNQKGGIASFTGIITFRKNEFLRDALKEQGVENLILETDSPYLAPEPKRGKENEPGYLALIGEYLSNYLSFDQEELANQSYSNACKFYDIKI